MNLLWSLWGSLWIMMMRFHEIYNYIIFIELKTLGNSQKSCLLDRDYRNSQLMDFDNLQHVNDSVFTEKTSTNCNRGFDVLNTAKNNFNQLKLALSHGFSLDFDQQFFGMWAWVKSSLAGRSVICISFIVCLSSDFWGWCLLSWLI